MKKTTSICICLCLLLTIVSQSGTHSTQQKLDENTTSFYHKLGKATTNISFIKHVIDDSFYRASGLYSCDIDRDGDNDILGAALNANDVAWWRNDGGRPIKWAKQIIDGNYRGAIYVHAADVDGDGYTDVLGSAAGAGELAWWKNDGDTQITWNRYSIASGFSLAHGIFAEDIDLDGDIDVLGTSAGSNEVAWWENLNADGIEWTKHVIDTAFAGTQSVCAGDIDQDGFIDVVAAASGDNEIAWWKHNNEASASWIKYTIDDRFGVAHWVHLCDIDQDGFYDVIGAAYAFNEIAWWHHNSGSPSRWTKQTIDPHFRGALTVHAADIDDDGDMDILGAANIDDQIAWWRNDGSNLPLWSKQIIDDACNGAWPVFAIDIDGDGDTDVLAGADTANEVAWYENNLYQSSNKPPLQPSRPNGSTSGKAKEEYEYSSSTTDPDADDIYYLFDWGDSNTSEWLGPYQSGETVTAFNNWTNEGTYSIKVKAKDAKGWESDWSDPLAVSMPYEHQTLLELIIEWILQLFRINSP